MAGFEPATPLVPNEAFIYSPLSKRAGVDEPYRRRLVLMKQQFLNGIETYPTDMSSQRIRNLPLTGIARAATAASSLPTKSHGVLELVKSVAPPTTGPRFQFNLDYSDFVPHQDDAMR